MQQREQYQTVFAKHSGSAAAPTASLHFTHGLMQALSDKGITAAFVTLHVGLGTFAPVTEQQLQSKTLHKEYYEIDGQTSVMLNKAKSDERPIIAVGTTVVRTLESAANSENQLESLAGHTDLFIGEGYQPKFVDGLITNFHVPRSSLLMLVSAFTTQPELMRMYQIAIAERYRLFSFGDGMLIL